VLLYNVFDEKTYKRTNKLISLTPQGGSQRGENAAAAAAAAAASGAQLNRHAGMAAGTRRRASVATPASPVVVAAAQFPVHSSRAALTSSTSGSATLGDRRDTGAVVRFTLCS